MLPVGKSARSAELTAVTISSPIDRREQASPATSSPAPHELHFFD